jgi:hypothetical protein
MQVGGDLHPGVPIVVDLLSQAGHSLQILHVQVDKGYFAPSQLFALEQRAKRIQTKACAPGTDYDDLSHFEFLSSFDDLSISS